MMTGIPATLMRGGTSKGLFFNANDLPRDIATRDAVLLAAMGSPDVRQIDGVGGAHPLTSKVAVVSKSTREDADVDYLFLQVVVDEPRVSDAQNCGNMLAGVGPWAIENGLMPAAQDVTPVRIYMLNSGAIALAHVSTPGGVVNYEGGAAIDGAPGTAAPIPIDFLNIAGSNCGALLPTGNTVDSVDGVAVTCIDSGMPVVVLDARDFGLSGEESPGELERNAALKDKLERIRLEIGPKMNLGDVAEKTAPKMTLLSPPKRGGAVSTRSFIPHRVHEAIGVLGAVSVATACALPNSVAARIAETGKDRDPRRFDIEHPTGFFTVEIDLENKDGSLNIRRAALLRTARKLMRGEVFVPSGIWAGK